MKKISLLLFVTFISWGLFAQKKPLDHSVYNSWQHIGERMISNDGKWVVYTIDPQEGDNELVIQDAHNWYKRSIPRGYNAQITEDSRYVIFRIKPFFKDTRDARIKKKKADDMPKDSLGIIELGKESIWKTEKVKNYRTPQKGAGWVAYQLDKPVEQPGKKLPEKKTELVNNKIADSLNHIIDSLQNMIEAMPKAKKIKIKDDDESDADGDEVTVANAEAANDLVLRNLGTGEEIVFYKVVEYYFSKYGDKLLVEQVRNPADSFSMRQVLLYDLHTGHSMTLSKGGNDFRNFSMTDDGSTIAYLAERDAQPKDLQRFFRLWCYRAGADSAVLLLDRYSVGMHLGMTVSEYGNLSFSKSGKRLFFGVAPILPPKDTSLVDFEHAKLDIWHYKDDYLQTVQTFPGKLKSDLQQTYLSYFDFDNRVIRQLATKEIPTVLQTKEGDGDIFVGITDFGKRIESQWRGSTKKDIYAIDVRTGEKKLVKQDLYGQAYPSYTGKYILWYDRSDKNYFSWDGSNTRNITEKIRVPLYNEENDVPDEPNNYGIAGWMEADDAVLLYDRYDLWKVSMNGDTANLTAIGRRTKTSFRYVPLDADKKFISAKDNLLLRTFNTINKEAGLSQLFLDQNRLYTVKLESNEMAMGTIIAARNYPLTLIYTKETFVRSPDLYIGEVGLPGDRMIKDRMPPLTIEENKLSAINSQQADYTWGTAELFNWKAYNGKDATGIVYKPDNFDPKKKYPMIIYFYEKLSQGLYSYKEPAPIRSAINISFFVSRGYILFTPDIEYKTGHPGQNAYDYIVSGARALVKKGWADSTNIAIQGHSWGGYQAAQLATMTKLFKAVWAGAPVANMTSAYGGIRWESGVSRQFQYEKTQSRIGGTLWEKLPLYMENSPLFHLDKVTAPMVIMANDADGAVPWYQGIELFSGMRRLGKKVWMFNYNGQGHGLTQRQDMLDYQMRMQQFFDWILKGEQPARWITDGVPAVNKGKDWGLD